MEWKTAQLIIAQAADLHVPAIKFNWKGEPTLNPNFKQITGFAKEHATNDTFIDRLVNSNFKFQNNRVDIFEGMLNQTKVKISFDSFIPGVMEKQRAGSIPEVAMRNITKFYNWPGRKTEIVIQAVRTKLNKDEDMVAEVKKRWPSAGVSVRDMVADRTGERPELLNRARDFSERQSCIQGHARLIFNWQGVAHPCCPDIKESLPLGDIKTTDMCLIWNGETAKQLRKSLLDKSAFEKDPCKNCSSFETFAGFRPVWNS